MNLVMENFWKRMRRYVSPVFLVLLVASFILWYIAKLSYTYTTEQRVQVLVDGRPLEVTCMFEGIGANLFGYKVYSNKTLRIPLAELQYETSHEEGHEGKIRIDPQSLQSSISVRYSDIKVVAIGAVPEIDMPVKP